MAFIMTYHDRNMDNIEDLATNTKKAVKEWYNYLVENEIDILIYETIRTVAQQRENVANGMSQTMRSYHLVGQALDFVPVNAKGQTLWSSYNTPKLKKAIAKAKELGFEWGGDWSSFVDKPHLQYPYKGYGTDSFTARAKKASTRTQKGDPNVKTIQTWLNRRYHTKLAVDGIPGSKTRRALVKGYQTELNKQGKAGLQVDGIWGTKTKAATKVIQKGEKGNLVYILQAALYIEGHHLAIDGIFGNGTERAVKSFQADEGLVIDGKAGPNTFARLFT